MWQFFYIDYNLFFNPYDTQKLICKTVQVTYFPQCFVLENQLLPRK